MTWRELKLLIEAQGVRDEDVIKYVDISGATLELSKTITVARERRDDDSDAVSIAG